MFFLLMTTLEKPSASHIKNWKILKIYRRYWQRRNLTLSAFRSTKKPKKCFLPIQSVCIASSKNRLRCSREKFIVILRHFGWATTGFRRLTPILTSSLSSHQRLPLMLLNRILRFISLLLDYWYLQNPNETRHWRGEK